MFHICTIVNDVAHREAVLASLIAAGFREPECIVDVVDNTAGNAHDPYAVLASLMAAADRPYVLFCHQDVRFNCGDGRDRLVARLAELSAAAPAWGVAGNAGFDAHSRYAVRITDPAGADQVTPGLPRTVCGLDENLLVVRDATGVQLSTNAGGFHLYGTDLCFAVMSAGRTCHVIDFHVTHLSGGNVNTAEFRSALAAFVQRWTPRLACAVVTLPTGLPVRLSRYPWVRAALARHWWADGVRDLGGAFVPDGPWAAVRASVLVGAAAVRFITDLVPFRLVGRRGRHRSAWGGRRGS